MEKIVMDEFLIQQVAPFWPVKKRFFLPFLLRLPSEIKAHWLGSPFGASSVLLTM